MGVRIDRAGTTQTVDYNFFGALWETTESLTWEEIDRGYITNYIPAPSKWAEWPLGVFIPSTPTKKTGQIHTEQKWQQKTEDYNFFGALWETTESLTWNEIDAGYIKKSVLISSELKGTCIYNPVFYCIRYGLFDSGTKYISVCWNRTCNSHKRFSCKNRNRSGMGYRYIEAGYYKYTARRNQLQSHLL